MTFEPPAPTREVFARNPLAHVIAAAYFHPILRIGSEQPVAFQERVRGDFPRLEPGKTVPLERETTRPGTEQTSSWQFRSSDRAATITLEPSVISFETTRYVDFPRFRESFTTASRTARDIYDIPRYTRVGLRYVNQVFRPIRDGQRLDWQGWMRSPSEASRTRGPCSRPRPARSPAGPNAIIPRWSSWLRTRSEPS